MADQNAPNSAARKDKAEGEHDAQQGRQTGSDAAQDVQNRYDESSGGDAGISNRPIEEEQANQEALPDRGERKGGSHA
jgi:hypothetical protein